MNRLSLMAAAVGALTAWPLAAQDAQAEQGNIYRVYFLGGQSNMDGYGFTADLPEALKIPREDIRIFVGEDVEDGIEGGGEGEWTALAPGFGTEFSGMGEPSTPGERFGPELTFGNAMAARGAARGDDRIAIIKFSRGGTALVHGVSAFGSWDPDFGGRNLYDQALTAIREAFSARDIDGDGKADRLIPAGIVWMQGEADAFDNWAASTHYEANLARMMTLFRAALHDKNLPVVIGRIKDSGDTQETRVMRYSPQVREAQARYAASDPCAKMVTATDGFDFIDGWHYRSQDYVALGEAFAEAMIELQEGC